MIEDLKSYREYQYSGVAWLGAVPSHWERSRLKRFLRPVDVRSTTGAETLLSLRRDHGVVSYAEHFTRPSQGATNVGYKLVKAGQLVVNRLQANNGLIFNSGLDGLVSPDYSVFKQKTALDMGYLSQLLRIPEYKAHFRRESTGLGTGSAGFLRLYDDRLLETVVALPPVDEQALIVRFLNHADRKIRRVISAKQRLIKLLEEQKQAIVHRVVTRGLDPNVRLKSSGVEWLGDVPEHWEVMLNQRVFKEQIRSHEPGKETSLSLSQRQGLVATSEMVERSLKTSTYENWKLVLPMDLVVNRFKAHLGVFFSATRRGIVSFHYGVFAARRPVVTKYFELLYHTGSYRTIFAGRSNGMTVGLQNLSNQNFYNVRTAVPPPEEQAAIVAYAESAVAAQDAELGSIGREISLLREYRTRLIADVVTGKLDVRKAAAKLPAEVEVDDPIDIDALGDEPDPEDATVAVEVDE